MVVSNTWVGCILLNLSVRLFWGIVWMLLEGIFCFCAFGYCILKGFGLISIVGYLWRLLYRTWIRNLYWCFLNLLQRNLCFILFLSSICIDVGHWQTHFIFAKISKLSCSNLIKAHFSNFTFRNINFFLKQRGNFLILCHLLIMIFMLLNRSFIGKYIFDSFADRV